MKVVAVTQRVDLHPDRNERRDALDQRLIQFLSGSGLLPVPVPNCLYCETAAGDLDLAPLALWTARLRPLGVVLSGGNDIGSCRERDATEMWLLDHAETYAMPVLGICRGMQMMGVRAGEALKPVESHAGARHMITGQITAECNSYHNFSLAGCPIDYIPLARSGDGELEAMGHVRLPWEGWMWHPERDEQFPARDVERMRALFA